MSKVYHTKEFGNRDAAFPADFDLVATVASEDLERVYFLTNHIDSPWTDNSSVEAVGDSHRSTSVGDVVVNEEGTFLCDICGWKELEETKEVE